MVAIMLALPDFIDRLLRPSLCTTCLDFRGLAFVLWAIFFAPAVLALFAGAWALRPDRVWPSWLALTVDLVILGLIAYSLWRAVTGQWASYPSAPSVPVQILQGLLVLVSDLVSLRLLALLVTSAYRSFDMASRGRPRQGPEP